MTNHQRKGAKSNTQVGKEFERDVKKFWLKKHKINLVSPLALKIGVGNKEKEHCFDLGCSYRRIIVECKAHRWTEGGNMPSAKLTTWDQAMFYFLMCPDGYRKCFFCLRDWSDRHGCTLAQYYRDKHYHMIPEGVEIWEYDEGKHTATRLQLHTS